MPWDYAFVRKGSDLQKRLRGRFGIKGLPPAILVGPEGQILHVSRGVGSGEETARAIQNAMAEAGSSGSATSESGTSESGTSENAVSENEGPGL